MSPTDLGLTASLPPSHAFPPGPKGLPLLGSFSEMARDRLGFFERSHQEYGDFVHFRMGNRHVYELTDPKDIEQVLVGLQHHFVKDEITRSLTGALGNGLLTSEGELWRHQRKLIAPSFQPRQIEGYARTMVAETVAAVEKLKSGAVIDIHSTMMKLTLGIVIQTLFDAGSDSAGKLTDVGNTMAELIGVFEARNFGWQRLLPQWSPVGAPARNRRLVAELDAVLLEIINSRQGRPHGDDLLSRLQAASNDEGGRMTVRQLRDEMVTMFLAGHETTAMALTYALHLLSQHPEIAARLRAEVDGVVGARHAAMSDVPRLKLCDAVAREAMRLYPPAWIIGREVTTEVPIRGHMVPVGAQVLMPQWVVHRDARWYDEPEAFRPDRWLDGLAQRLPAYAYFPFGGGPRVCVGNHFAMMELVLVLATLSQTIDVAPVKGFELELLPAVTLRPKHGLPLEVRRRTVSAVDSTRRLPGSPDSSSSRSQPGRIEA